MIRKIHLQWRKHARQAKHLAVWERVAHLAKAGIRLASIQLQETSGRMQPAGGIWYVSLGKVNPS